MPVARLNDELHTAEWIVARLESDTGAGGLFDPARSYKPSGAYFEVVPQDRDLPAVRFHVQARTDIRGAARPAHRIISTIDWLIVVITEGNGLMKMVPLADALDTRLQEATGETSTILVLSCVRIEPFTLFEESDSGVHYRHAGGLYRTIVQPK
jgi:hypothetical protein